MTKKPVQDCQRLISNIEERARPATMSKRAIRSCSDDITDTSVQQFYKFRKTRLLNVYIDTVFKQPSTRNTRTECMIFPKGKMWLFNRKTVGEKNAVKTLSYITSHCGFEHRKEINAVLNPVFTLIQKMRF